MSIERASLPSSVLRKEDLPLAPQQLVDGGGEENSLGDHLASLVVPSWAAPADAHLVLLLEGDKEVPDPARRVLRGRFQLENWPDHLPAVAGDWTEVGEVGVGGSGDLH